MTRATREGVSQYVPNLCVQFEKGRVVGTVDEDGRFITTCQCGQDIYEVNGIWYHRGSRFRHCDAGQTKEAKPRG